MSETMRHKAVALLIFASLGSSSVVSAARRGEGASCAEALAGAKAVARPKSAAEYVEPWSSIRLARERCQSLSTPLALRGESLLLAMQLPEFADGRTGTAELRAMALEFETVSNEGAVKSRVLEELAGRLAVSGQEQEAEDRLEEALRTRQRTFGVSSSEYRDGLMVSARIRAQLAAAAFDAERNSDLAEAESRKAVELSQAIEGKSSPKALDAWMNLAQVLDRLGRVDEAEAIREEHAELWLSTQGTEANPRP